LPDQRTCKSRSTQHFRPQACPSTSTGCDDLPADAAGAEEPAEKARDEAGAFERRPDGRMRSGSKGKKDCRSKEEEQDRKAEAEGRMASTECSGIACRRRTGS
jgi:hypothetical protein